jgi:hypothetical protein
MTDSTNRVWISCTIENTGFSSERRFEAPLGSSGKAVGTAFIEYLTDENGNPLQEGEPSYGQTINGSVQCRIIKKSGDTFYIEFPSTDVFHVPAEAFDELRRNR